MTKSWLVLLLHLIGWEGGASFLDQSQSVVIPDYFRHSIENCSINFTFIINQVILCKACLIPKQRQLYTSLYNTLFNAPVIPGSKHMYVIDSVQGENSCSNHKWFVVRLSNLSRWHGVQCAITFGVFPIFVPVFTNRLVYEILDHYTLDGCYIRYMYKAFCWWNVAKTVKFDLVSFGSLDQNTLYLESIVYRNDVKQRPHPWPHIRSISRFP